jgi:hypothetical protein
VSPWKTALADRTAGKKWRFKQTAGEVLTAKQAPHRPGTAPALGLRGGALLLLYSFIGHLQEGGTILVALTFRIMPEELEDRRTPSACSFNAALSPGRSLVTLFVHLQTFPERDTVRTPILKMTRALILEVASLNRLVVVSCEAVSMVRVPVGLRTRRPSYSRARALC